MPQLLQFKDFFPYVLIGGVATLLDWGIYWALTHYARLHYGAALIISYLTAGLFHYTSNKCITFKCLSKQIGPQYSFYMVVTLTALAMSMALITFFIHFFQLNSLAARIITTLFMLLPNYLLHKHVTFNKKIFRHPA